MNRFFSLVKSVSLFLRFFLPLASFDLRRTQSPRHFQTRYTNLTLNFSSLEIKHQG